jgi:signal transduction histidine kinase
MRPTLRQLLLLGLTGAIAVALIPAGVVLDRSLAARLEASARSDLARAPMVLEDRNATRGGMLMMHAREVAGTSGLGAALASGDLTAAERLVSAAPPSGESAVLVDADGRTRVGVAPDPSLVEAARNGEAPVGFVEHGGALHVVSIAPILSDGEWLGAAGVAAPVDATTAGTLAGLTAAEVVILAGDSVVAATVDGTLPTAIARAASAFPADGQVREAVVDGRRHWLASKSLGSVGRVVFALDSSRELAILPALRRGALLAGVLAVSLALLLGAVVATGVARPVRGLALAADRLADGDFHAPLERSRVEEVDRMAHAFGRMRATLEARLAELSRANEELAERQDRLRALQAELIRRDRLAASGRLVTELAHEIRNPVANIRNCLEVVRRRLQGDPEGRRFADLAIDELLRMHELAEQMLDMNRPLDPGAARADPTDVLRRVAELFRTGSEAWSLELDTPSVPDVAMAPDTLKQVLLSLIQNAREAMPDGGTVWLSLARVGERVVIEVADDGPGIEEDLLDRIFDPFFTTKGEVSGVGLGLFIAQGLVTRSGGRLTAHHRDGGTAAVFRIELPVAGKAEARRVETRGAHEHES